MARKCVNTVLYTNDLRRWYSRCIGTASLMKSWQRRRRSRTCSPLGVAVMMMMMMISVHKRCTVFVMVKVELKLLASHIHFTMWRSLLCQSYSHLIGCVCVLFHLHNLVMRRRVRWTRGKLDALHPLCCIVESFANSFRGIILIENFHCSYRIL